jgi:hypothetical protein
MSWLKRLRGKRSKSKDGSADEVRASSQQKKPDHDAITVRGEQVCALTASRECASDLLSGSWSWYEFGEFQPHAKCVK